MKHFVLLLFFLFLELSATPTTVTQLDIKGAIGPASATYLKDGMKHAQDKNSQFIVIKLDTPGGLSTSMREMIQGITNSTIPVVTYVYPKGARAASAGTYLLYASHVAAMSPGTNLGAATPVNMMPTPKVMDSNNSVSTLEKKAINDAVAYIKSLAELNNRNVSWAISAVKESKSISANEALKIGVIDIVAEDITELLNKLDGRTIKISNSDIVLNTKNVNIEIYEADWKTTLLSIITNPNVAYIFLLIAIYGIFFELMNPGAIFPGVVGVISGVIALYALNMIPFNYAGLLLIALGVAFMVAEVLITGFGVLGIGGVISFAIGSLLLFDADTLGEGISIPLVIAFTMVSLGFFILVMRLFIDSTTRKVVSGAEEMAGSIAEVLDSSPQGYHVYCHGERWSAKSESELQVGQKVEVIELIDLVLNVREIKE